jgi:hypothetical protein
MYTSRPLAEAQAEQSTPQPIAGNTNTPAAAEPEPTGATPRRAAQLPVVDINFEDIPEQQYEDFAFPLKTAPGIVWVLGIDDDAVLFDIMEVTREDSPNEIIKFCLGATFRYAVDESGEEIENGLKKLMDYTDPHRRGEKESRKYLMEVVMSAVDKWCEELTDTSMRPQTRAQRRARPRRR